MEGSLLGHKTSEQISRHKSLEQSANPAANTSSSDGWPYGRRESELRRHTLQHRMVIWGYVYCRWSTYPAVHSCSERWKLGMQCMRIAIRVTAYGS